MELSLVAALVDVKFLAGVLLGAFFAFVLPVLLWGRAGRAQKDLGFTEDTLRGSGAPVDVPTVEEAHTRHVIDPRSGSAVAVEGGTADAGSNSSPRSSEATLAEDEDFDLDGSGTKKGSLEGDDETWRLSSEIHPANAPKFPFLKVRNLLPSADPPELFPNLRGPPQAFTNNVVDGKAIVALRVRGDEDPEFAHFFEGKNRRFQLMFQITLKEDARGTIYLGGEVPRAMQLGVVTKNLCKAIVSILTKLSTSIHCSFGTNLDKSADREVEYPHMVFPVFTAATRLNLTRAGEGPPPPLGNEIEETPEQVKQRKKRGQIDLKKGDTLTFSLHSMYIDIVQWKVTNLGALGSLDLSMFWDTMPLRLVMYDLPPNIGRHHFENLKRYFMAFAVENTWYRRKKGDPQVIYPEAEGQASDFTRILSFQTEIDEAEDLNSRDSHDLFDDESPLSPVRQSQVSNQLELGTRDLRVIAWVEHAGTKRKSVSFVLMCTDGRQLFVQQREAFNRISGVSMLLGSDSGGKGPRKIWEWEGLRSRIDDALRISEPQRLMPGWLKSHSQLLRARSREEMHVSVGSKYCDNSRLVCACECPIIRPLWETRWQEEWALLIRSVEADSLFFVLFPCNTKSPSIVLPASKVLETREINDSTEVPFAGAFPALEISTKDRVIVVGFRSSTLRSHFGNMLETTAAADLSRPSRAEDHDVLLPTDMATVSLSLESNRWGSSKRTVLNSRRLCFNMGSTLNSSTRFAISDGKTSPTNSSGCFKGSTQGSPSFSSGLGVVEEEDYFDPREGGGGSRVRMASLLSEASASKAYFSESDALELRRKLEKESSLKPWELTSVLLQSALGLNDTSTLEEHLCFLDQAAQLRQLNVAQWSRVMTHEETFCFTLNLYHALRLHAKFLVGQPSSVLGWASFGSRISYAIGSGPSGDATVLSLAEIEHCVLRKPMSLARTVVSTSYTSSPFTRMLELRKPEPRLNLVLNYGTKSCATYIVVLDIPSQMDRLLDLASANFLEEQLKIDEKKRIIGIPKIASWYGKDFFIDQPAGSPRDLSSKGIALQLLEFCGTVQSSIAERMLRQNSDVTFKVRSFKWKALDQQHQLQVQ